MEPSYGNLVMQGGGVRCFWQAGFLSVVAPHWERPPATIFAVSASAGIACGFAAGRVEAGVEAFKRALSCNRKNFYASRLLSGQPMFPHATMYRALLHETLNESGMQALRQGPDIQVLLCRPRRRMPAVALAGLAFAVSMSRQYSAGRLCGRLISAGRLTAEFVSVRSCRTAEDVADLVLASSCTPPFTPMFSYRGGRVLDGGTLESVPLSGLTPDASALVLLTKRAAASLPRTGALTCVGPSRTVDGSAWDYTSPRLIDAFFGLGRDDGRRFIDSHAPVRLKADTTHAGFAPRT